MKKSDIFKEKLYELYCQENWGFKELIEACESEVAISLVRSLLTRLEGEIPPYLPSLEVIEKVEKENKEYLEYIPAKYASNFIRYISRGISGNNPLFYSYTNLKMVEE